MQPDAYWQAKKINKPYEFSFSSDIYINVYAETYTGTTITPSLLTTTAATQLIYSYYGRHYHASAPAAAPVDQFMPRAGTTPIIRYKIGRAVLDAQPDATGAPPMAAGSGLGPSIELRRSQIDKFIQHLRTSFPVYQQQLKFYKGSISPSLNFLELLHQVELFFENLKNFVAFNGAQWEDHPLYELRYGSPYAVPYMVPPAPAPPPYNYIPNPRSPRSGIHYIMHVHAATYKESGGPTPYGPPVEFPAGINFHFVQNPAASGVSLQNLLINFSSILSEKRTQINWMQFVHNYLPNITVNPHGKPSTPKVWETLSKRQTDTDLGQLGATEAEAAQDTTTINDPRTAERAFLEANQEIAEKETSLQMKLDQFVNKIQNVADEADAVMAILDKYNVTALMEAALECLLFHTPGYAGTMPDFVPGIDPFMPRPPRIRVRFPRIPTRLAIPSINKQMRLQLREGLRQAALSSVMSIMGTLADLIKELCLNNADVGDDTSEPLPDVVRNFLDPLALDSSLTGDPLAECYADAGLEGEEDLLYQFFSELSPLITAREMCDLLNGSPSNDVKQIVDNLLDKTEFSALRVRLSDVDSALQLFECIGRLVDPAFCQNVYNAACIPLPAADPCLVNELPAWVDLIELLENIDELIHAPDMSCGGPLVPSPAAQPPFIHTVTDVIDAVVSAAQQSFLSDLGGFKQNLLVIDPNNPVNQSTQELLASLQEAMPSPNDPPGPPAAVTDFFTGLIPTNLQTEFAEFQTIANQLTDLDTTDPMANIANLQSRLTYEVAPRTQALYYTFETDLESSPIFQLSPGAALPDPSIYTAIHSARTWAFESQIPISSDSSATGMGERTVFSISGRPTTSAGAPAATGPDYADKIMIYHGSIADHFVAAANNMITLDPTTVDLRRNEAVLFKGDLFSLYNTLPLSTAAAQAPMATLCEKKLYPFAYFSLFNAAAYRTATSPLFTLEGMNNLNLFPKFCAGGGQIAGADLLDVDSIKQNALNEFLQAACAEQASDLGPVREAALLGVVSLYFQVLVVDLILKNIFITARYGTEFLSSTTLLNELLYQITIKIIGSFNFQFFANLGLPKIVKKSAALLVRKMIVRVGTTFSYPLSGQPATLMGVVATVNENTSLEDTDLQSVAIQYMLEERLVGSADQIREVFNIRGDNVIETFLYEGILDVDMWNPESYVAGPNGSGDHAIPSPWIVQQHGYATATPSSTTTVYSINNLYPPTAPPALMYYVGLDYIHEGDLLWSALEANLTSATGTHETIYQQALNEVESFLDYGALVKERYVEVVYSATAMAAALSGGVFSFTTPEVIASLQAISDYFNFGNQPAWGSTYLIPFPDFIELFAPIAELYALVESLPDGVGDLPIPFFLAGSYPQRQSGCSGGTIGAMKNSNILGASHIELGDSTWDDSSKTTLSDYALIRYWMHTVAQALPGAPDGQTEVVPGPNGIGNNTSRRAQIVEWSPGPVYTSPLKAIPFSYDLISTSDLQYMDGGNQGLEVIPAMRCDRIKTWIYDGHVGSGFGPSDPPHWETQNVAASIDSENENRYVYSDHVLHGSNIVPDGSLVWSSDVRLGDFGGDGVSDTAMPSPPNWKKLESKNFVIESVAFRRCWKNHHADYSLPHFEAGTLSSLLFPSPGYPLHSAAFNILDMAWENTYPTPVQFFLTIRDKRFTSDSGDGISAGGRRSFLDFYGDDPALEPENRDNYQLMVDLMETYPTETELITALDAMSAEGVTTLVNSIFPSVKMANRIAYVTPSYEHGIGVPSDHKSQDEIIYTMLADNEPYVQMYKSFYGVHTSGTKLSAHFATDYNSTFEVSHLLFGADSLFLPFLETAAVAGVGYSGGFSRFIEHLYQTEALPALIPALASQSAVQTLFGDAETIDVQRIIQYLYLVGELRTYYDLFSTIDIFEDTKYILLLAMQAAFADDDYAATTNCDVTAVQNMAMNGALDAMGPFAGLGRSFLNKMLKETPKHILKGVVEMTEPHVMLAKLIRETSKGGFQQLQQILDAGNSASGLAGALMNTPQLQLPCPDEFDPTAAADLPSGPASPSNLNIDDIIQEINNHIDLNYPDDPTFPARLKPRVSKEDGIDLEGSLPYTFFVPPLTPFGIIYLLLQLSQFPINQVQTSDDPADCD